MNSPFEQQIGGNEAEHDFRVVDDFRAALGENPENPFRPDHEQNRHDSHVKESQRPGAPDGAFRMRNVSRADRLPDQNCDGLADSEDRCERNGIEGEGNACGGLDRDAVLSQHHDEHVEGSQVDEELNAVRRSVADHPDEKLPVEDVRTGVEVTARSFRHEEEACVHQKPGECGKVGPPRRARDPEFGTSPVSEDQARN